MGHFKGLGVFSSFYRFEGILVIFRFQEYFGHFLGLGGVFWSFIVLGVIWSFLGFRDILVIL